MEAVIIELLARLGVVKVPVSEHEGAVLAGMVSVTEVYSTAAPEGKPHPVAVVHIGDPATVNDGVEIGPSVYVGATTLPFATAVPWNTIL